MTDTNLPNPFTEDFNSAPPPDADTAVASCAFAQVPDAAVGYYTNSDRMGDGSLPSGEIEAAVTLPPARSESVALNILEQAWLAGNNASIEDCDSESSGYPACGHLAATVDDPAVAALSIPESAVTPPAPQVTSAGVIDANGAGSHEVSSPADFFPGVERVLEEVLGLEPILPQGDDDPAPLFLRKPRAEFLRTTSLDGDI